MSTPSLIQRKVVLWLNKGSNLIFESVSIIGSLSNTYWMISTFKLQFEFQNIIAQFNNCTNINCNKAKLAFLRTYLTSYPLQLISRLTLEENIYDVAVSQLSKEDLDVHFIIHEIIKPVTKLGSYLTTPILWLVNNILLKWGLICQSSEPRMVCIFLGRFPWSHIISNYPII